MDPELLKLRTAAHELLTGNAREHRCQRDPGDGSRSHDDHRLEHEMPEHRDLACAERTPELQVGLAPQTGREAQVGCVGTRGQEQYE